MAEFIKVCSKNDVQPGRGKTVTIKGKEIAILNDKGKFYAIDNTCAHVGGSLGDGDCNNKVVTCPLHSWEYNLETGENTFDPSVKLNTYEVKLQGNDILISSKPK